MCYRIMIIPVLLKGSIEIFKNCQNVAHQSRRKYLYSIYYFWKSIHFRTFRLISDLGRFITRKVIQIWISKSIFKGDFLTLNRMFVKPHTYYEDQLAFIFILYPLLKIKQSIIIQILLVLDWKYATCHNNSPGYLISH